MLGRIHVLLLALACLVLIQAAPAPVPQDSTTIATTTTTTTPITTATRTSACYVELRPRATGPPIVAITNGTSVSGLQLYDSIDNAVLRGNGLHQGFSFNGGAIGKIEWSFSCSAVKYLNIGSSSTSYKPLTWSYTKLTTDWASTVDIATLTTSVYGAVSDFIACSENGWWKLYLQTGTDTPAGLNCAATKLKLVY